jgi:hypothetical protein
MEPKDLKNPEGLKSTEKPKEEKPGKTTAQKEKVKEKPEATEAETKKEQTTEPQETGLTLETFSADEKSKAPVKESTDKPETGKSPDTEAGESVEDVTEVSARPVAEEPEVVKEPEQEEPVTPNAEAPAEEKPGELEADEPAKSEPGEEPEMVKETEPEKAAAEEQKIPDPEEPEAPNAEAPAEEKPKELEADEPAKSEPAEEPEVVKEPEPEKAAAEEQKTPEPEEPEEPNAEPLVEEKPGKLVADEAAKPETAEKSDAESKPKPEETPGEEAEAKAAPKKEKHEPDIKEKKPSEPIHPKKEKPDYATLSLIELVNAMRDVLDSNGDHDIKDEVEAIKAAFYKQVKEETEEQKKQFIEDGGDEEEFEAEENPYEQDIKDLLKRYRQIRHEFNKKMEQEKEVNLQVKYDIIEEIKGLIHKEESINKTFQEFRDLQQRWREIGLVPQARMKDLWDTYHFHVESFYDYIKINRELRDLDLKKNLEMKIKLCEQAEELLLETNIIRAFNQLQKLHDRWREIGPVPRENKDDIWERFKASTAKINKKHQEYFEGRKTEQKNNLEAKRALCEQVEEINEMELDSHKDWGEKSKEVVNLQRVWRTIGFAPRKDNNKIYKRFREACDAFFDAKREFYSKNKELQQNNLQLKTDLCMQAEALKESTDWRKTTQDLINIQKQWKEIGPVPRKNSEALWKRFRAACDYFFEKKSEHFSNIDSEQDDNLKAKEQLVTDVESFKPTDDADENLKVLKDFQRRWTEIGHVPIRKKDDIQKKYREAINKLFDDLNLDESKRNLLRFRTKMASFSESSRGQNKMRLERDKYMNKLKQLENDLVLLDNNIGFFAKSKNAEALIKDVKRKIDQTREKIEMLKDKIRVIDEMDQSEE